MGYTVYMIQKTVYFRNQDDLDKFNALPNKAEWLHEHLNTPTIQQVNALASAVVSEPKLTPPEETA